VTFDGQPGVVGLHSLAVVLDAKELLAAELDDDGDPASVRVERVLDELLDNGRRPLDDLARGDLVGEMNGQPVNAGHRG
jgi:hypothetical protein